MGEHLYKVMPRSAWQRAVERGVYEGSTDDLRDGFIHLSRKEQVPGTLQRHFAGQRDLVLVSFDADALGPALRYEPSRAGALFPHLYGTLSTSLALEVVEIS
jgi:uncharacterized protein (DUF952 family)